VGAACVRPARASDTEGREHAQAICALLAQALWRLRLAASVQAAQSEAQRHQLQSTFLAAVSHDLRTPLAAIVGASSSLVRNDALLDAAARRELGQSIYEEATRMAGLANNLLDMARLEAGSVVFNRQWQPLEEVVGAGLAGMSSRMGNHPVTVKLPNDLPLIEIDGMMLERVFANLLENAVKYTPSGTAIEISAAASARELVVTVSDHGPGIPAGEKERIFEKFHRVAREGNQGGAGLGLTICRSIVEAHGGRMWADSSSFGGAAFHFTLPLSEPPLIEQEEATHP
jgi:two-component system sensor histidine kinase KdpD